MFGKFLTGVLSLIFVIFAITSIFFYFSPFETTEFVPQFEAQKDYNFSSNGTAGMQFYENMRYPDKRISYRIDDSCNLQKNADMESAFGKIEDLTIVDFYPVIGDEEISVVCKDTIKVEENFFIAGEGGPTNITKTENFNVISHGGILLLRNSDCENPNVAIHELLHAMGFGHSQNKNNIMYEVSRCGQTIGDDIISAINSLYSVDSKADLSFENASAKMNGRYLDLNLSIRNNGLKDAAKSAMIIYADGKELKQVEVNGMKIGYGVTINLRNIFVSSISIGEIKAYLNSSFDELDKKNNEAILKIKK